MKINEVKVMDSINQLLEPENLKNLFDGLLDKLSRTNEIICHWVTRQDGFLATIYFGVWKDDSSETYLYQKTLGAPDGCVKHVGDSECDFARSFSDGNLSRP